MHYTHMYAYTQAQILASIQYFRIAQNLQNKNDLRLA